MAPPAISARAQRYDRAAALSAERDDAQDREHAHDRMAGAIELLLVRIVVLPQVGVERSNPPPWASGWNATKAHGRAVVRVLPGTPEIEIGVHSRRHLLGELLLPTSGGSTAFERDEQPRLSRLPTREETLILRRVELPVRLEVRALVMISGEQTRVVRSSASLTVIPTTILLLEQDV